MITNLSQLARFVEKREQYKNGDVDVTILAMMTIAIDTCAKELRGLGYGKEVSRILLEKKT